jgi:hypothetical protein
VTFYDGTTKLGTGTLCNGVATLTTKSLHIGTNSITVVYGGDCNFLGSTSGILTLKVNQDSTTTNLTSSNTSSVFGQAVTFTATVLPVSPGSGTPTGTVTFMDGTVVLGTVSLCNGVAKFTISSLARGKHSIKAIYNGDSDFLTSTSAVLTQTVS